MAVHPLGGGGKGIGPGLGSLDQRRRPDVAGHDHDRVADVPDANSFHADIDAIRDAGVTARCGGGNDCPDRNVTRAEMAAFMNRLGALATGKTPWSTPQSRMAWTAPSSSATTCHTRNTSTA